MTWQGSLFSPRSPLPLPTWTSGWVAGEMPKGASTCTADSRLPLMSISTNQPLSHTPPTSPTVVTEAGGWGWAGGLRTVTNTIPPRRLMAFPSLLRLRLSILKGLCFSHSWGWFCRCVHLKLLVALSKLLGGGGVGSVSLHYGSRPPLLGWSEDVPS